MQQAIAFDVNETLLDLGALDPLFATLLGDPGARREWFTLVIHTALTTTAAGGYEDFGAIGAASLRRLGERRGISLSNDQVREVATGMRQLPAHPDVQPALERLRAAGARMVTLTNNPLPTVQQQLASAGLRDLFHAVLSCDQVRQLKPGPRPYRLAAEALAVPIDRLVLVAAHDWDVAGALAAGAGAAFVSRPGHEPLPVGPAPTFTAPDLAAVADLLVARR